MTSSVVVATSSVDIAFWLIGIHIPYIVGVVVVVVVVA